MNGLASILIEQVQSQHTYHNHSSSRGENKSQPFSVPLSIVAAHFLCLSDIFQGLQQTRLEVEANVVVADTILIARR